MVGPADDAGCAEVALAAGEVGAFPVAGRAAPEQDVLGAVVAREDDQCVACDRELVEQVEQRAEVGVELEQAVGPVALGAATP